MIADTKLIKTFEETNLKVFIYRTFNINDIVMYNSGFDKDIILYEIYEKQPKLLHFYRIAYIVIDEYNKHIIINSIEFSTYNLTLILQKNHNIQSYTIKFNDNMNMPYISIRTWLLSEIYNNDWYIQVIDNESETYKCLNAEQTIVFRYRVFNIKDGTMIASIPSFNNQIKSIDEIICIIPETDGYNLYKPETKKN